MAPDYQRNLSKVTSEKLIEKYIELWKQGKEIKINGFVIQEKKITVEKQGYYIIIDSELLDIGDKMNAIRDICNDESCKYDFHLFVQKILKETDFRYFKKYSRVDEFKYIIEINGIKVIVQKDDKDFIRINTFRCRAEDVKECIARAVCFNDQKEYDNYIQDISILGLEMRKLINNGIVIRVRNSMTSSFSKFSKKKLNESAEMLLRFSLWWDPEKRKDVYLVVNGKKHKIKKKEGFKDYFGIPEMYSSITNIATELEDCLKDVNQKTIIGILEDAHTEAKVISERGKKLLEVTKKESNAIEEEINTAGYTHKGVSLVGIKTGRKFFIEEVGLNVYIYENGIWNRRCVVSDHNKNRIFEDRYANRIMNIYNENDKIGTIWN